jgi:hypothetical protein
MRYRIRHLVFSAGQIDCLPTKEVYGPWLVYRIWRFSIYLKRVNGSITEFLERYNREKRRKSCSKSKTSAP